MNDPDFDPRLTTHELTEAQLTQIQGGTSLVSVVKAVREAFAPRLPNWIHLWLVNVIKNVS